MKKKIAYIGAAMALSCNPMNIDNLLDTVPGQEDTCRTQMENYRDEQYSNMERIVCSDVFRENFCGYIWTTQPVPEVCRPDSNQYMDGWNPFKPCSPLRITCPEDQE